MGLKSRILIADDESRICDSLKFLLERHEYEVKTASNGKQALDIINNKEFDLFLLDIGLPEMNGLELMEQIINKVPDALVVMMTGNASVESAISALKKGAHDYFKKPIELEELLKTVKNSLEQKRLKDENKVITEKLKRSEQRYRFMIQNSPDIIYTLDQEGKFIFVNKTVTRLLGYEPEKLLNQPWTSIVHEKDIEKAKWFLYERRKGARAQNGIEIRLKLMDNSDKYRRFEIRKFQTSLDSPLPHAANVTHKNKKPVGTYGVARDISYRRQLELQLFQSDKMDAINTLAGGIAHDFNNLLMGIQGYTSLLLLDINPGHPHHEKLKNIEHYIQSATDLTKQLLGFARGGKYEVKPTNLNKIVEKSSQMFGRTKKELRVHTKYQEEIWTVEIDPGQIEQVLLNLYVNAWQAIAGSGDLYIKTENFLLDKDNLELVTLKPGRYAKVSVADNGSGMDEATMQRIFEPFFTTKKMGRGTGLGLASAYGIIKNHDGIIRVKSKVGYGSKFEIYLPASEKMQIFESEVSSRIIKGTETVLLVDDEELILKVGKLMLTDIGYNVLLAKSGMEAIEVYRQNQDQINIVILDIIMPEMDGSDVYDQMKKINPNIKVLLSSGYSMNGKATRILEKGCKGFLQKPFDLKKLSHALNQIRSID